MVDITQLNSLSFMFLLNKLQSIIEESCFFAQFLPVLKQNTCIIAQQQPLKLPYISLTGV